MKSVQDIYKMAIIKINKRKIGENFPTYFIADIGANHDGSLSRAKKLIKLAAKAGADAVKFQHFKAETIVSDLGFKSLGKISHQKTWKKSVFQVYKDASINNKWTPILEMECKKNGLHFLTSPYDLDYIDSVNKYIPAYKIGSGDINWYEAIIKIAKKNKPVLIACGASNLDEVKKVISLVLKYNKNIVLMQCNTNYTATNENINFINLNVIKNFSKIFKNKIIFGLSDHTFGSESVLGSIALGARVIEKHFTDDNNRVGPDHNFAMNPTTWKQMIKSSRILERMLGDGIKRVEKNETSSIIIQRRALRSNKIIKKNSIIKKKDIIALRPCPKNAISPEYINRIIGKKIKYDMDFHDVFTWEKIK
jgi:sialic acid synthase SpsE